MKKLLFAGSIVALMMLAGRVAGFLREVFIAHEFGVGEMSDAVVVILTTPDVMINLLVGGAFATALVPAYARLGEERAGILYREFNTLVLLLFALVSALMSWGSAYVLDVLAPGINSGESFRSLFNISLMAIPLSALAGNAVAYLQYRGKIVNASSGTLIFNISIILALMLVALMPDEKKLPFVVAGVIFASIARWAGLHFSSRLFPFALFPWKQIDNGLLTKYMYAVFSGGILFVIPVIMRSAASISGEGQLTLVNFSIKLIELPIGVLFSVLSMLFLAKLSSAWVEKQGEVFDGLMKLFLSLSVLLSFLCTVALCLFPELYVGLVFGWGLDVLALEELKNYLFILSISIIPQFLILALISVYASVGNTRGPLGVMLLSISCYSIAIYTSVDGVGSLLWMTVAMYSSAAVVLLIRGVLSGIIHLRVFSEFLIEVVKYAAVLLPAAVLVYELKNRLAVLEALAIAIVLALFSLFVIWKVSSELKLLVRGER